MKKPLNLRVSLRVLSQDLHIQNARLRGCRRIVNNKKYIHLYNIEKKTQFLLHQKGYRNEIKRKLKSNQILLTMKNQCYRYLYFFCLFHVLFRIFHNSVTFLLQQIKEKKTSYLFIFFLDIQIFEKTFYCTTLYHHKATRKRGKFEKNITSTFCNNFTRTF